MTTETNPDLDWRRKYGRPTKLEEAAPVILEAIGFGMSRNQAAQAAHVDDATVARWEQSDADFRAAMQDAREAGVLRRLRSIQKAGDDPARWQATAWLLERTYPDRFALVNRVQVDARVVTENMTRIASQLGIDLTPELLSQVVDEVKLIAAEDAKAAKGQ